MVNCGPWYHQCARCFSKDLTSISRRAQLPTPQDFLKRRAVPRLAFGFSGPPCFHHDWPQLGSSQEFKFSPTKVRRIFKLGWQCKLQFLKSRPHYLLGGCWYVWWVLFTTLSIWYLASTAVASTSRTFDVYRILRTLLFQQALSFTYLTRFLMAVGPPYE